jgi:cardiolipin synthase
MNEEQTSDGALNNVARSVSSSLFGAVSPAHGVLPWREGNAFWLLIDGDQFFPRMLEAIQAARCFVLLEMYLFSSGRVADRFIEALARAAERGVSVFMLLDDFGARELSARDRSRLAAAGIRLGWYRPLRFGRFRPYLSRDHRKLLLVDGEVAFTGGLGISDDFDPPVRPERRWRETAIEIRGPVVGDWLGLFADTWSRWSDMPLPDGVTASSRVAGGAAGRVRASHRIRPVTLTRSLVLAALRARRRVWMATAYFIPSRRVRRVLRRKARRGVDVRLLLPGPITDHPGVRRASHRYYARLLRHGVRIFEYQPRFLHAKVVLCDDWVSIGSSNFDRWNLRRNLEANQESEDPALAAQVQTMFEADFRYAKEIEGEAWRHRPWYQRLVEWFWGRVELLLDKDV